MHLVSTHQPFSPLHSVPLSSGQIRFSEPYSTGECSHRRVARSFITATWGPAFPAGGIRRAQNVQENG